MHSRFLELGNFLYRTWPLELLKLPLHYFCFWSTLYFLILSYIINLDNIFKDDFFPPNFTSGLIIHVRSDSLVNVFFYVTRN